MESWVPSLANPNVESELASRAYVRKERELPRCTESSAASAEPSCTSPNKEKLLPMRAYERSEGELPMRANDCAEN